MSLFAQAVDLDIALLDKKIDQMMPELGFKPDDNDRLVASFSGGWQMRMCLGKMLLQVRGCRAGCEGQAEGASWRCCTALLLSVFTSLAPAAAAPPWAPTPQVVSAHFYFLQFLPNLSGARHPAP